MARSLLLPFIVSLAVVVPSILHGVTFAFTSGFRRSPAERSLMARHASVAKAGVFSPLVNGAKGVLGEDKFGKFRGEVIKAHTKVITEAIATSESGFGKMALSTLFNLADKDGNGTLDKEEIHACLKVLGFKWIDEPKVDALVKKGDENDDELIDMDEFMKIAPVTLRQNLIKLAKQNGNNLGFLV
eukprot:TRINITY_DN11178_c0_g1_i1.p1 TRINITY_DN11178_c0_g1~~TRINITY_DN11178_c0_g1_i1.p1  ORF type:complete len:186 (+),score=40.96 TRINITY_DN11178_c0_g1_i1:150-707(+)